MKIKAGEFKAKCLKLMDEVNKYHKEIIITKFGKPVAKLVPADGSARKSLFGYLRDSAVITGDIVKPVGDKWDAD